MTKTESPEPLRARITAIYIRLTREESRKKGLSASAQREEGLEYAKNAGLAPVEIFEEPVGVGGDKPFVLRTSARELVAQITEGRISDIIVRDIDRLTRDVLLWLELARLCEEHDTRIHTFSGPLPTSSPSDRLSTTVRAAVAQHEREQVADRVRRVKRQLAKQGRPVGGPPPFGYTSQARHRRELIEAGVPEDQARIEAEAKYKHTGQLYVNRAEAKVVRLIFRLYASKRLGCRQIANDLNRRGVRRRTGKMWHPDKVRRVINDPTVAGFIPFDQVRYDRGKGPRAPKCDQTLYKGQHKAIIDEAIWRKAQRIKQQNRSKVNGRGNASVANRRYALSGVLECRCGARMKTASKNGDYAYYACRSRLQYGPEAEGGCDAPRIAIRRADEALWSTLSRVFSDPVTVGRVRDAAVRLQAERSKDDEDVDPEQDLRRITTSIDVWYDRHDAATDDMQKEAAWHRILELKARQKQLRKQIEAAEAAVPRQLITLESVEEWLTNLCRAMPKSKDNGKLVIEALIEHHDLRVRLVDAETMRITLVLHPPGSDRNTTAEFSVPVDTEVPLPKGVIDAWIDEHKGQLKCGICGAPIPILRRHYWVGLPTYHHKCWASQLTRRRTNPNPLRYVNGRQAAEMLGISRTQLGRWIKRGVVTPVERRSNVLLFDKKTVETLAEKKNGK